ncbi:MAG: TIGR04076 family protein [bacterium]|nr:TIGR04076 family protein [bacterium]
MWRVHHTQCPDPNGRVIFKIERTGKVEKGSESTPEIRASPKTKEENDAGAGEGGLKNLRIEVESSKGRCTSRMKPGDRFLLRSGRLYIPPGCHFCLYAMQAVLPLLPAKQRVLQDGDWMNKDCRVICPDPAGNTILRIDRME